MKAQSYLLHEDLVERMKKVQALTGNSKSEQIRHILNAFFSQNDRMLNYLREEYRVKDLNGFTLSEDGIKDTRQNLANLFGV